MLGYFFIKRCLIIAKYKFGYIKYKIINNLNILSTNLITNGIFFIRK